MQVKENVSLKAFNTFSVDVKAKYFVEVESEKEIKEVLSKYSKERILILGGGSNTLFLNDIDGLVIKVNLLGKTVVKEDEEFVYIACRSGENWDEFVRWTVDNGYAGLENMVMIPGTVGGAVAQNIAAYGQNITDTFVALKAVEIITGEEKEFTAEECGFQYRSSSFKREWRNKYLITSSLFKLKKNAHTFELNYHERAGRYGSLLGELQTIAKEPYTLKDVEKAVVNQRTKRLPSVEEFGTCGSFFENPVVTMEKYKELSKKIVDLQCYPVQNLSYEIRDWKNYSEGEYVKIPAGRLLDELGWLGKWDGNVGVSEKHALCVVSNKKATGKEILKFIKEMQKSVKDAYGIDLVTEVNILE